MNSRIHFKINFSSLVTTAITALVLISMMVPIIGQAQGQETYSVRQFEWEYAPDSLVKEGSTTIAEGNHYAIDYQLSAGDGVLEFTVIKNSGPNIDLFFLTHANFLKYSDQEAFQYFLAYSDLDTAYASRSIPLASLSPGEYHIVIDNTELGSADPTSMAGNNPVNIEYDCSVTKSWELQVQIPKSTLEAYEKVSQRSEYGYLATTLDPTLVELARNLESMARDEGYDTYDEASFFLTFVQSLLYTSDSITTGFDEFPRFPLETLAEQGGDCEDSSLLLATLLKIIGSDVILLSPPSHMAVGIAGEPSWGSYVTYQGVDYVYCETTGEGWEIGELPPEVQGASISVHEITGDQYIPGDPDLSPEGLFGLEKYLPANISTEMCLIIIIVILVVSLAGAKSRGSRRYQEPVAPQQQPAPRSQPPPPRYGSERQDRQPYQPPPPPPPEGPYDENNDDGYSNIDKGMDELERMMKK